MYYINSTANESGNYGNPQSNQYADSIALPDELLNAYIACRGFAVLTVENGIVTAVETNEDALTAYLAEFPDEPDEPQVDEPTTDDIINTLLGVDDYE